MPVSLYMDVHVAAEITKQLRRRGVNVLTAQEDGAATENDEDLLARATELGRVLFTQDIRFWARAWDWQEQGRPFAGLVFGAQVKGVGLYVRDLELIAKASEPSDWIGVVEFLPFKKK